MAETKAPQFEVTVDGQTYNSADDARKAVTEAWLHYKVANREALLADAVAAGTGPKVAPVKGADRG